jgi:hypothetical protein
MIMGRPRVTHSNTGQQKAKLEKLLKVFFGKVNSEILTLASEGRLADWDVIDPVKVKEERKRLLQMVKDATVGGKAGLEPKIVLQLCMVAYMHDTNFRKMFEDAWL